MNSPYRFYNAFNDWKTKSRYRDVIRVCAPLVMSMAAVTVMGFTDRVFLSNYSLDAISAATPAGVVAFLFIVFFSGVAGYASVLIAQYCGTGAYHRVGTALWQALFFAVASAVVLAGISLLADPIFKLGGHPAEVQRLETIYFRILCLGAGGYVAQAGLASFFTGLGLTRPVMLTSIMGMIFNIPLDYALINGVWGCPQLGIAGAAIATVASWGLMLGLYIILIFTKTNDRQFHVRRACAFDKDLFYRLMVFGVPGSLQFCLDILAFTFFIFMVGRIGKVELAASNIVIAINSLAFMPAMGFSQGVSTLVGQALGERRPRQAKSAIWSAVHLLLIYILVVDLLYIFAPQTVIALFIPAGETAQTYTAIADIGRKLLCIVAAYVFMDALYMIFVGALRGAGDTRFIMTSIAIASLAVMVLPVFIGIELFKFGVFYAWACVTMFIASLFALSAWRYRQGKWQAMLVVERQKER